MSRLVLFVDGEGDVEAAPALIGRLRTELPPDLQGWLVDTNPFRTRGLSNLTGRLADQWPRYLEAAVDTRANLSAVLLLLDADTLEDTGGCVRDAARALAEAARGAGAGELFSVAIVFFRQEYESLLIASYASLPGRREGMTLPENVEEARGAKGWLKRNLDGGYKEAEDQITLTRAINFDLLRQKNIRSFRRLEHAITELATAIATGEHIVSPPLPTPPKEAAATES
jgi:hypothetical protein